MAIDFTRTPPPYPSGSIRLPVAHYTGALNVPDGDAGEDPADVGAFLRRAQRDYLENRTGGGYTRKSDGAYFPGYPLGYNFAVDWLGGVWVLRGFDFLSAATNGHNGYTVAVLFFVDGANPANDLMWSSARAIGREARRRSGRDDFAEVFTDHGSLRIDTGVGTVTPCAGPGIRSQLAAKGRIDQEDDDMEPLDVPERVYDSRSSGGQFAAGEVRTIAVGMCRKAFLHVTAVGAGPGFVSMSGTDTPSPTSIVNLDPDGVASGGAPIGLPDGHVRIRPSAPCHLIVDVFARG